MVRGEGFEPSTTRFQIENSGQTELTPELIRLHRRHLVEIDLRSRSKHFRDGLRIELRSDDSAVAVFGRSDKESRDAFIGVLAAQIGLAFVDHL